MSLETAAGTVAEQMQRQEFVEVYAHHDADGIAAASILCHAMLRAGIRFRLRIRKEITLPDLGGDAAYLLCDLGAGVEGLPRDVMVVDHHLPLSEGEFHVNPRLAGIDGDRELSAAGAAYYVAQELGDNRDLAGLVIPGIIGDGQQMAGKNLEIFNEGIANGIIAPDRGITLPGRDMTERWYMAISPYLDGISGAEERITALLDQSRDPSQGDNGFRLDTLLSQVVLDINPGSYLQQTLRALLIKDVMTGLVKAVSFGAVITVVGAYQGFKVEGGADEVGRRTTASVVASIFLIIVFDLFFTILFYRFT